MRKKTLVFLVSVLLVLTLFHSGCTDLPMGDDKYSDEKVKVHEVTDGDTIEVEKDDGEIKEVRILGIDTPEVHVEVAPSEWEGIYSEEWLRRCGHRATNFTKRWIGNEVTLVYDEEAGKEGYYGRTLAYIELGNGTDLGAELIKHGWARVYEKGDFERESDYMDYEIEAREQNTGVWSASE